MVAGITDTLAQNNYQVVLANTNNDELLEVDYLNLTRILGIDKAKVLMAKHRKIKARAIWYDDIKAQIVPKEGDVVWKESEE